MTTSDAITPTSAPAVGAKAGAKSDLQHKLSQVVSEIALQEDELLAWEEMLQRIREHNLRKLHMARTRIERNRCCGANGEELGRLMGRKVSSGALASIVEECEGSGSAAPRASRLVKGSSPSNDATEPPSFGIDMLVALILSEARSLRHTWAGMQRKARAAALLALRRAAADDIVTGVHSPPCGVLTSEQQASCAATVIPPASVVPRARQWRSVVMPMAPCGFATVGGSPPWAACAPGHVALERLASAPHPRKAAARAPSVPVTGNVGGRIVVMRGASTPQPSAKRPQPLTAHSPAWCQRSWAPVTTSARSVASLPLGGPRCVGKQERWGRIESGGSNILLQ
mmetsp:Transcript_104025/g.291457  ORF Transcript_104025/g.291457 Transcript_104025/m.291457 type:complete len:342 (-) Transcript_104025:199-1224(-)